jgi:hypothetical protein
MLKNDLQRVTSLFLTSRVRVKIMTLFYMHPREKLHMRKIAREIHEQINAVRRELISMEKTEFLISHKEGIKKFYLINNDFPLFNEFRSIFVKSFGLGFYIYNNKKELGDIKYSILSHTYLNREDSDSNNPDMLIVGEPDMAQLDKIIKEAEVAEQRKLHYMVISEKELEMAKKRRDPLIYSLSVLPRSMILGSDEGFVM